MGSSPMQQASTRGHVAKARESGMRVDVAIVGGGLSGLVTAAGLSNDTSWVLLEAHPNRLGGRLLSSNAITSGISTDLGAAWVWPRFQPRIRNLLRSLDLHTFDQPDDPTSTRIVGGAISIVDSLYSKLDPARVNMGWPLTSCKLVQDDLAPAEQHVLLTSESGSTVIAKRVVLAVPPKLISERIAFTPPLSPPRWRAMCQSQTWMAGVTKVALVFESRFWTPGRTTNMGLPTGASKPAFQVYDSGNSGNESSPAALTFFALAPPRDEVNDETLARQCAEQLAGVWRMFSISGIEKLTKGYTHSVVQRWPEEQYVSDDEAPGVVNPHPKPVPELWGTEWGGRLIFGSSEAHSTDPGVMEGAVGAGESALAVLAGDDVTPTANE